MADLTNFVTLLNGEFDNKDQFEKMCKINPQYPYAKHINTICNSKIENLPKGFEGVFMIEESYYSVQGTTPFFFTFVSFHGRKQFNKTDFL